MIGIKDSRTGGTRVEERTIVLIGHSSHSYVEYDRIAGIHVPISMKSTADVLVVGTSSFSMDYKYSEINGKPIQ